MEGALHTDLWKSETSRDKISFELHGVAPPNFENLYNFLRSSNEVQMIFWYIYRGSPTSTVSTNTNSTSTHFEKSVLKLQLYDFESKSPTCTISINTICH